MAIIFCLSTIILAFSDKHKLLSIVGYGIDVLLGLFSIIIYFRIKNEK